MGIPLTLKDISVEVRTIPGNILGSTLRLLSPALAGLMLSGCGLLRGTIGLNDVSAVQAPAYSANKVLFLDPPSQPLPKDPDPGRFVPLSDTYELARKANKDGDVGLRRSVRNRQPLSIVISHAYLPASLKTCAPRLSDIAFGGGRDIAVLLDVAGAVDSQEFIAVWYERDVKPGDLLNFQDLLVYSRDAWDSKFPPYFRLRLVDVSFERNTAVGGLLDKVRDSSKAIAGLAGSPEAGPIIGIAALAAKQVLAHENNIPLVDFTFQLYGASLLDEAGGVPLGVLQSGGVLVTAPPCVEGGGVNNEYWTNKLQFDNRLNRIVSEDHTATDQPYISATILTADLSVPQIVRTRSDAILKRLTDPQVVQSELINARDDAEKLVTALNMLSTRESFRRRPSKAAFSALVQDVSTQTLDDVELGFFLDGFYQITGRNLPDVKSYQDWIANCSSAAEFKDEAGRFKVDKAVNGADGKPCWPGA